MLDLSAALSPTLKMFLVKLIFYRYFGKFLVTTFFTEMTEGYIATLLSFQIFLISRFKFSNFIIFSASALGRLGVKGIALAITSAVLFSLGEHYIRSVEIYCFVSVCRPVPI